MRFSAWKADWTVVQWFVGVTLDVVTAATVLVIRSAAVVSVLVAARDLNALSAMWDLLASLVQNVSHSTVMLFAQFRTTSYKLCSQ